MLSNVRGDSFEEKLASIGLTTLRERRIGGDAFGTLKGHNRVRKKEWFTIQDGNEQPTRQNTEIVGEMESRRADVIVKERANTEIRRNSFTQKAERI